jgi:CubicO group peptidase (beta-lactamase class C family)
MRRTFVFIIAGAALLLAAVSIYFIGTPANINSQYEDFRYRLDESALRRAYADYLKETAVPSSSEIIAMVEPLAKRSPGAVVVGLIDRNRQMILGWGKDESGKRANGDTVFEIASISKAFAGLLLAQMAQEGKVALEAPVEDVLTETRMPAFGTDKVTLRQLATHSSGLPPWPDNRGDTTLPYSNNDLCCYLRTASLMGKPDSGIMYSNTAFALLGDVLALRENTTFNNLLQKRICKPLGMTSTQVGLPKSDKKRLAIGHWADGNPAQSSSPTAGGAADGIRSTTRDLLKFLSAYIQLQPTDFDPALRTSYKRYISFDEHRDSGLGWFVNIDNGVVDKGGHIAGYRTYTTFDPNAKCAVVVLAAWEAFPSPELGTKLLNVMIQRRAEIEEKAAPIKDRVLVKSEASYN